MNKDRIRISKAARFFANIIFKPEVSNYAIGDLEEDFCSKVKTIGQVRAVLWFWFQLFLSVFTYIRGCTMNNFMLYSSYFKIGIRSLLKDKGFAFTNITGLSIGMTLCLLIVVALMWEISYDRYHENIDRLYRVTGHVIENDNIISTTVAPVGPVLKKNYPEVIDAARYTGIGELLFQHGDITFYDWVVAADKSLFEICTFPVINGDSKTALENPNSILIDVTTAEKLFGSINPVGKTIRVEDKYDLTIGGVFQDIPMNSSFQFSIVFPWAYLNNLDWFEEDKWDNHNTTTIVLLDNSVQEEDIESKIINLFNENNDEYRVDLSLLAFKDIHLNMDVAGPSFVFAVFMFTFIGIFILLISCINFVNLSTARSSFRFKEIGLRKILGGTRKDIIRQFFSESFIIVFVSFVLSLALLRFALNAIYDATGNYMSMNVLKNPELLFFMLLILFFTGFAAGSYPALHLSSFLPVDTIKGMHQTGKRSQIFRRMLVITQFTASIIFIISALITSKQAEYIFNYDTGWNSENIMHVLLRGDNTEAYDILKTELIKNPKILHVTAGSKLPINYNSTSGVTWLGKNPQNNHYVGFNLVDYGFTETFEIDMIEGRTFSEEKLDGPSSYIVNESLAKIIGAETIIGSDLTIWDNPGKIIGVTRDYNFRSLKVEIEPMAMLLRGKRDMRYMILKLSSNYDAATLDFITRTWENTVLNHPLEYSFIDDQIYQQYNDEDAMGIMMKSISLLALFMTCTGLVGLVTFMTERRKKEIGVRKVHGASVSQIVQLISKEFLILVTISNAIAWPLAYLMMKALLDSYAVKTEMGIGAFIFAGVSTILITFFTISYRSFKAARANPITSLRYE